MSNKLRPWIFAGFVGLIIIGAGLILAPVLSPAGTPAIPTPIPTALTIDQSSLPYPAVPRVAVGEARAAHESKQAVFVDVRSAEQYAQSHIPGALSIPLSELESRLNELRKDQWIITYCI